MFQKKKQTKQIPVTVDKSHLITIGEKLYTEKMSFVRELVNNAYDADASVVTVDIKTDRITIRDNGSGMDEADLRRYFAIGASEKRVRSFSPVYGRKRIGEFGIGKFAALAASKKFEIDTQRGDFHARLIFDKENWSQHEDWHLNTEILESKKEDGDGTIITLLDVSFTFYPGNVRRYLSERVPIHSPDFSVYLNGEKVEDAIVSGKKITIKKKCDYGTIEGEMIIIPEGTKNPRTGIGIYVKDVLVKYEPFGLGGSKKYGSGRVAGKINADFLPITSSRDDFIRDSDEFVKFRDIVICELKKILKKLKKEGNYKANLKASRVLKEALDRIGRAMKGNKEMIPGVQLSLGGDTGYPGDDGIGHVDNTEGYKISKAEFTNKGKKKSQIINSSSSENVIDKDKKKRVRTDKILGDKSVLRHLKVANLDIAIRMDALGSDEGESALSGGVIYINLDHVLYKKYQNNEDLLTMHLIRIITKELAMKTGITDSRQAFDLQSELIEDALKTSKKGSNL